MKNVIYGLTLLSIGVYLFLLFFHPVIETEDVWWHLSVGRWIVQHMQVPHQDLFPFSHEKNAWISYGWLGNVIFYLVFKAGGLLGLKVFRSLFFISIIGIFFNNYRKFLPFSFLCVLSLLMSCGLFDRSLLRPDMFNALFVSIFLIMLFSHEDDGRYKPLFILLLAGILWANVHLGAFVYGIPLIGLFFVSTCVTYLNSKVSKDNKEERPAVGRRNTDLLWTFLAFFLVFLITPYGIDGFLYPFKLFLIPSYLNVYKQFNAVEESQSPVYLLHSFSYIHVLFILGCLTLLLNKKNNFSLVLIFIFASFMFLWMLRNIGFYSLVALYVIAECSKRAFLKDRWENSSWPKKLDICLLSGCIIFALIQSFNIWQAKVVLGGQKVRALSLQANPYSVAAIQSLKDNGISGAVFNDTLLGGLIIWLDYPGLRPVDDGRHVDQNRFNNFLCVAIRPDIFWQQAEKDYGFKIVTGFAGGEIGGVIKYIDRQPDWQLIAVHGPIVTYVKRGAFHLPKAMDRFERRLKSEVLTGGDIQQLKIISQEKQAKPWDRFFDPSPMEVDAFTDGETLMSLGYKAAAANDFIEAFKAGNQLFMQKIVTIFLKQL